MNESSKKFLNSCRGGKICGNCIFNERDCEMGEYVCTNADSEAYGCPVGYTDHCSEHEFVE